MFEQHSVSSLEIDYKTVVVAGDFHFPYHDPYAVSLFLKFVSWLQPHTIVLNGDIIDFYSLSKYDKDPRRLLSLQDEIDTAVLFLRLLRKICPKSKIYFIEGNHEERLRRWLSRHPEVSCLRALTITQLLELNSLKIQYVPYEQYLMPSTQYILHHGTITRSQSSYTARANVDSWCMSGINNHTHRMGTYYKSALGMKVKWFENGCLCSLHPEYVKGPPVNWQHGFCVVNIFPQANKTIHHPITHVEPIHIEDYTFCYRDQVFLLQDPIVQLQHPNMIQFGERSSRNAKVLPSRK